MRAKLVQHRLAPADTHGHLLLATWTLTRQAKRDRDRAQAHYQTAQSGLAADARRYYRHSSDAKARKQLYYRLKGQTIAHLVVEGVLSVTGLHRFGNQYAELVEGGGFRFHRPCPAPLTLPEGGVIDLGESLESGPRKRAELGVRAAVASVREYLDGKPELHVYQWPAPSRRSAPVCWNCGEVGHLARDCSGDDDDDDLADDWND